MEDIRSVSSEASSSLDSEESVSFGNCVRYGPIQVFRRKGNAPTLLTGRKSKFEELQGEELAQRERRREKNRLSSRRLKEKRDNIQNELIGEINELENEHSHLLHHVEELHYHRSNLANQVEQLKDDPLMNLIEDDDITLFFEEHNDQLFDDNSLYDEHSL